VSTKIHHGWRLEGVTMPKLLKRLIKLRDAVQKIASQKVARKKAERVACLLDSMRIRGRRFSLPKEKAPWRGACVLTYVGGQLDDDIHKSYNSLSRSTTDYQCNVTVHPIGHLDLLLLLFDNDNSEYREAFENLVRAKPFPYWNNTDRPDDLSESEWDARGALWHKAFGTGVPAENGYSFDCMVELSMPIPTIPEILAAAPSVSVRRTEQAEQWAAVQLYRNIRENKADFGSFVTAYRLMRTTPKGRELVKRRRKEIRKAVRRLTKNCLLYTSPSPRD